MQYINNEKRRGSALVATLVVVSSLAIFGMALLTTTVGGARTINHQTDEFKLSSTVDSVALLSMEDVWADYIAFEGGAPGGIQGFRTYLDSIGMLDAGPGGPPAALDGFDLLPQAALPTIDDDGEPRATYNGVYVDSVQLVRRDIGDSTQLYVTVTATTRRGTELTNPVINRRRMAGSVFMATQGSETSRTGGQYFPPGSPDCFPSELPVIH